MPHITLYLTLKNLLLLIPKACSTFFRKLVLFSNKKFGFVRFRDVRTHERTEIISGHELSSIFSIFNSNRSIVFAAFVDHIYTKLSFPASLNTIASPIYRLNRWFLLINCFVPLKKARFLVKIVAAFKSQTRVIKFARRTLTQAYVHNDRSVGVAKAADKLCIVTVNTLFATL